jgi:hypothetical protein
MEPRKPYPPDLNDYAWDLTTHLLPEATPGGRPEQYPTREILNGIFSIVHDWRGGCSRTISHLGRLSIMTSDSGSGTAPGSYQACLQRLTREVTQINGQIATTRAPIERLKYELERRYVRAPMAGRLGEVAKLQVGTVVREGDRLGAVVPPGMLKVMADFLPPAALGRIQPGQPARLRLEGFPWTQYGAVSATVASVAHKVRDGQVRVELTVHPDAAPLIPLQHGLPETVEVEVDCVSPAALILCTAGLLLTVPGTSRDFPGTRGADR